ncbi:MAG TPA: glycosyltransferase [Dongiaceae bacterium]|nr:glycosyltransferase [Dongiaceae bacterium]
MTQRVLFYVQHLLGIGHLRRAAALSRALVAAGAEVAFVSGGEPVPSLDLGGARLIQLPPASAADAGFSRIVDQHSQPIDDAWQERRRDLLLGHFAAFQPDLLLIEMYPFGRRPFRFELLPLLDAAMARRDTPQGRPLIACSLRDILVDKGRADRRAETVALVERYFDLVLVHGDPRLVTLDRTFPEAGRIAGKLRYTGYVVELPARASAGQAAADRRQGEILISAGGGAVGAPLFAAAIGAKTFSRYHDQPWRLLTGRNLPPAQAVEITRRAREAGIAVETFRSDFPQLLQSCLVSISQGGYNTVMELLAVHCPAVIVPFADGSESEQSLRGELLAARGLLELIDPKGLDPAGLAAAIDRAAQRVVGEAGASPWPGDPLELDLDGASRTARLLLDARA